MAARITRELPSAPTPVRARGKSALAASRTGQPPAHGRRRKATVKNLVARVGGMDKVKASRKARG